VQAATNSYPQANPQVTALVVLNNTGVTLLLPGSATSGRGSSLDEAGRAVRYHMSTDLQALLDDLEEHVKGEMAVNPEIVDKGDDLDVDDLPVAARKWHQLSEGVAVMADLKGSTNLGVGKHAASTAAIYEAATGGLTQIFNGFAADFVAIQGDGAFGLFWGERRMERAICAGITVKTFSQRHLVPRLEQKWPDLPATGFKVGMAVSKLLVKRIGVPRTAHQEPVWAGKAVNYAAKCAQQAGVHEMIVTGSVWDFVEGNDYLAVTCPCGTGPSDSIWGDVVIDKIHEGDGERAGRTLTSQWCEIHGIEYCGAVLDGETTRPEAKTLVESLQKSQRDNSLRLAQRHIRENRRNTQRGLAMKNR
jgi:class 3 adenylate cyclase